MEAIGILLIVLSLPLMLRWIPPNHVYGLRSPATLRDTSVWYDANALSGRHLLTLGLLMVALEFVLPASIRLWTLRVIGVVGFSGIMIADWRTANRWARERKGGYIDGDARPVEPHRIGRGGL
jgi:uncharacterized membrane protein